MMRTMLGFLTGIGLALTSTAGLASQPDASPGLLQRDDSPKAFSDREVPALDELQPGDRLDQALYERGQVSRFGIRREIVRIGNHEFIIDDQDRLIIHISIY